MLCITQDGMARKWKTGYAMAQIGALLSVSESKIRCRWWGRAGFGSSISPPGASNVRSGLPPTL